MLDFVRNNVLEIVFLVALVAAEVIRFPHRMRNKQELRQKKFRDDRTRPTGMLLDMLAFVGTEVVPLVYILTDWLDFADYRLPLWAGWSGALAFAAALWLLWRSHADLGRNWSPTLQITQGHGLVTEGVYRHVRHPIYAAMWLWGIAQALLLQNWIAGLAGLVLFLPVYLVRVPREERMMLDHFGEAYRAYMGRTGRVIPRLGR